MARPWSPAKSRMGDDLVKLSPNINVSPNVSVPINLDLGGLPLSVGLFVGSGAIFLFRTALPEGWAKDLTLALGGLTAAAGVVNLLLPKASAAPTASASTNTPPSAPSGTQVAATPGFTPSGELAFSNVSGRIISPEDFSTVDVSPWASGYTVRVQLQNNSETAATFELELSSEETPSPVGSPATSSVPVQVTLGSKEIRDIDVEIPLVTWGALVDYIDVILTARKRRAPGESPELIDTRSFVIE